MCKSATSVLIHIADRLGSIGGIIAYWLTYGTAEISSEWAFRLPFLLQMVPALMVGIGIHLFPYSPRWLCMRGPNLFMSVPSNTRTKVPDAQLRETSRVPKMETIPARQIEMMMATATEVSFEPDTAASI